MSNQPLSLSTADVQYDDDYTLDQGTETGLSQGTLTNSYSTWYTVDASTEDTRQVFHWITLPSWLEAGLYYSSFYYKAVQQ
ncbi:hypothetical protein ACFLXN_02505 [Chloroflexota bacterium]